MSEHEIQAVIDACYATAFGQHDWDATLGRIGSVLNAKGALLVSLDAQRTANTVVSRSLIEAGEAYASTWWSRDSRIAAGRHIAMIPGRAFADADFMARDAKHRDPFFQEFCRTHELDEMMALTAEDPVGGIMSLSVPRHARLGPYEAAEIDRLQTIGPHVARACSLSAILRPMQQHAADLAAGLESLAVGVIVADPDGRVRHINSTAELLARGCLRLRMNGMIVAANPREQARLDQLLASASSRRDEAAPCMLLRATDGRLQVFVEAVTLRTVEPVLALSRSTASGTLLLLRAFRPAVTRSILPQLERLGLTATEARVAANVGRGFAPKEAASMLGMSDQTVRAHLRSIYAKLEIGRQAELAIIVTRLDHLISG